MRWQEARSACLWMRSSEPICRSEKRLVVVCLLKHKYAVYKYTDTATVSSQMNRDAIFPFVFCQTTVSRADVSVVMESRNKSSKLKRYGGVVSWHYYQSHWSMVGVSSIWYFVKVRYKFWIYSRHISVV